MVTSRVLIGPLITPLPRRRTHQLARETVSVDRLSGGRLVLGVGIGSETTGEFDPARFGEEGDMRERARLLDDGLEQLVRYWDGEFEPRPVQRADPGLGRRALAAQEAAAARGALAGLLPRRDRVAGRRARDASPRSVADVPVIVTNPPEVDPAPWFEAGATWCLTGFGPEPTVEAVQRAIDAGP